MRVLVRQRKLPGPPARDLTDHARLREGHMLEPLVAYFHYYPPATPWVLT
jgi:hypothetical protein